MSITPEELASQLRKPSGEYGIQTGKMMNDGNKFMYQLTYSLLNLNLDDKVLEIGFGNGKFIPELIEAHQVKYFGVDYSDIMVEEAKKLNQEYIHNGSVKIFQADLSNLPFEDNFFDVLFTINTIYFWANPVKDLQELKRVLKPGGKIFIAIRPKHLVENFEFTKHGFTLYEADHVEKLLMQAEFSSIQHKEQSDPEMDMQGKKVTLKSICVYGKK